MRPFERLRLWWQIQSGEEDTLLDGDTPAWLSSLAFHLAALVGLTLLTAVGPARDNDVVLLSQPVDLADEIVPEEFHFDDEPTEAIGALSFGGAESPEAAALVESDLSDVAATIEMPVELHFGNSDSREESLDSGFGPFGLTRLCYETGGIYFAIHPNRNDGGRVSRRETAEMASHLVQFFDPQTMRRYRPDYISVKEYNRLLATNQARSALVEAAKISWATSLGNVRTRFPKESEPQLATDLSLAQRDAAKIEPKIRRIYEVLKLGERDRAKLRKPRWQAGYDLAMGRSLAVKVRTETYNALLAKAKQGMKFNDPKNDTWVLVPSVEISVGSAIEKQAEQAKTYLKRVMDEHEGTPWHLLAKRELRRPLGWRWTERYTGVNAPQERSPNVNNNPRRRDDRLRMLGPRKPKRPPPAL